MVHLQSLTVRWFIKSVSLRPCPVDICQLYIYSSTHSYCVHYILINYSSKCIRTKCFIIYNDLSVIFFLQFKNITTMCFCKKTDQNKLRRHTLHFKCYYFHHYKKTPFVLYRDFSFYFSVTWTCNNKFT